MTLPVELNSRIVAVFAEIPNISLANTQQALVQSAGFESELRDQISIGIPAKEFAQLLTTTLTQYGTLSDGRNALVAALEAARCYFGQEGQAKCDDLIRAVQSFAPIEEVADAFVPGYDYDIFVSSAEQDSWVTTLLRGIEKPIGLSQPRRFKIHHHPGQAHPEVVRNSTVMLVILSHDYLHSEQCRQEREAFLEVLADQPNPQARIFLVARHRLDIDSYPSEFKYLPAYTFWMDDGRSTRILGDPAPDPTNPADRHYYDLLTDLGRDLDRELTRLKDRADRPDQPQEPEDTRPAVYLAEVTDDLMPKRDQARRFLNQQGFQVLPQIRLDALPPEQLEARIDQDLAQCTIFVQLLSAVAGRKPPNLPATYNRLQYLRAEHAGKPIFQWCDPALKADKVDDREHRDLLKRDTVMAIELEEFKREIAKHARPKPPPKTTPGGAALIFLNAHNADDDLAQEIDKVLEKYQLGCALPLRGGKPSERRKDLEGNLLDSDGVIVVYGKVTVAWAREQLRYCRKLNRKREEPLRAWAVYDGPPEDKENLGISFPDLHTINCRKCLVETELQPFIEAVKS